MSLLVEAFAKSGCDAAIVEALREAAKQLRGALNDTGATAKEIRAIAAGVLDTETQRRHFEQSMKALHESTVAVRGEVSRRKLRHGSSCRLARIRRSDRSRIPWMVTEACSPKIGQDMVEMLEAPNGFLVTADPDLHPTRRLTLGFADLIEGIGSLYETETDREAELSMQLVMSMKRLQIDIFLHESLPPIEPQLALYFVGGLGLEHGKHRELRRVAGEFEGRFIRSPGTSIAAQVDGDRYLKLLEHGAEIAGHPLDAFRCFRIPIAYPPTYTLAVVRWLLPTKPRE